MATYYINNVAGSDSNSGTTEGAAWSTLAKAAATCAAKDKVYVKNTGTGYSLGSTVVFTQTGIQIVGYTTTPGASDGRPTITSSASGVKLIGMSADGIKFEHLQFTHTGSPRGYAIYSPSAMRQNLTVSDCVFDGCARAIDGEHNLHWAILNVAVGSCVIKNCTEYGMAFPSGVVTNSAIYNCNWEGWRRGPYSGAFGVTFFQSIIRNNGLSPSTSPNNGYGLNFNSTNDGQLVIGNCSIVSNAHGGLRVNNGTGKVGVLLLNNIFFGTGGDHLGAAAELAGASQVRNAFGGGATNRNSNFPAGLLDIALASTPFESDFTLNAGVGATLKNTAYAITDGVPGFPDVGHWQAPAAASAGGAGKLGRNPLISRRPKS